MAGLLITIPGVNWSANGYNLGVQNALGLIFGSALDCWINPSNNTTVASNHATALTDSSSNATAFTGSVPFTPNASGSYPGLSNNVSGSGFGYLETAANPKVAYDWNKPFSFSAAFIYGGAKAGQDVSALVKAWDSTTSFGCGYQILLGAFSSAFSASNRVVFWMKPFSAASADGNYVLVYGSTSLTVGQLYRIHVSYDGSGTAAGVQIYVNGVAETMSAYGPIDVSLTSTWINSTTPQPFQVFDSASSDNGESCYGTLLEAFFVSRKYTTGDVASADAYLGGKY